MARKGVRGSCFMDLLIGTIMLLMLPTVPLDDFNCAQDEQVQLTLKRGEYSRYTAYLIYSICGLFSLFILQRYENHVNHDKIRRIAACMIFFMLVLCGYIAVWSVIVIGVGIHALNNAYEGNCSDDTSLWFR